MSSKKLTPEEITANEYQIITECGVIAIPIGAVCRIMKQYAAQQVSEKDALLKEAIGLLKYYMDYDGDGSFDGMVNNFLNKATGTEDSDNAQV